MVMFLARRNLLHEPAWLALRVVNMTPELPLAVFQTEQDGQRAIETMEHGPVCGMAVSRERANIAEREGTRYAFCSRGCRDEFFADSARFTSQSENYVPEGAAQ